MQQYIRHQPGLGCARGPSVAGRGWPERMLLRCLGIPTASADTARARSGTGHHSREPHRQPEEHVRELTWLALHCICCTRMRTFCRCSANRRRTSIFKIEHSRVRLVEHSTDVLASWRMQENLPERRGRRPAPCRLLCWVQVHALHGRGHAAPAVVTWAGLRPAVRQIPAGLQMPEGLMPQQADITLELEGGGRGLSLAVADSAAGSFDSLHLRRPGPGCRRKSD